MAVEITLAQFNKIAIGDYNAGFVDFKTDGEGNVLNELRKVNNHVYYKTVDAGHGRSFLFSPRAGMFCAESPPPQK